MPLNMLQEINISGEDIAYAEKILLPEGQHFCPQRVTFIKRLDTLDLQAVPGSGKTTALLAKLLILERKMPLKNGVGVLVISHTNAAVEEIESKIRKHCPRLFSYPNFIGTIQSFVDRFLAIPAYTHSFCHKPYRIDNEIYEEKAAKYFDSMPNNSAKLYLNRRHEPTKLFASLRFDQELNLIAGINGSVFLKGGESPSSSYNQLKAAKINLIDKGGYLHFDHAYFFAEWYLKKFPKAKSLLQNRFQFVFVDEMQDMDKHQYDILENIFGDSEECFQRIGDKNQTIYSSTTTASNKYFWNDRYCSNSQEKKVLEINGSYRLTPENAKIVKCFGLETIEIEGKRDSLNIKPHLIVFDNPTDVLPTYTKLLSNLFDEGKIPEKTPSDKPFFCVGWRSEHEDASIYGIRDYFTDFEKSNSTKTKIDYSTLSSYIACNEDNSKTLSLSRKNILNAIVKTLRIERVYDKERNGRNFTKNRLLDFLKENHKSQYDKLKINLYNWSLNIIKGRHIDVLQSIQDYVPIMLEKAFEIKSLKGETILFLNGDDESNTSENETSLSASNNFICDDTGIKVNVGTVHSVKGQTHTSTLYVESYYNGRNGKNGYESERLSSQLLGRNFPENEKSDKKYHIDSTKMTYVGLSRPTHLLCFAIHKSRFESHREAFENLDDWKVIEN